MGIRGEVFSVRYSGSGENRSYFFNVKENRNGDLFLNIVESKQHGGSDFERHQIVVFDEDLDEFRVSLEKVLEFMRDNKKGNSAGRRSESAGSREYGGSRGHGGAPRRNDSRDARDSRGTQYGHGERDNPGFRGRSKASGGTRRPGSPEFAGPGGPRSGERGGSGDKPRSGERGGSGDRPRYGERGGSGDKPRYGERGGSGDRPRYGKRSVTGGVSSSNGDRQVRVFTRKKSNAPTDKNPDGSGKGARSHREQQGSSSDGTAHSAE